MGLENDLNLVSLHQRQEEISENEMKVVVAGEVCRTCLTESVFVQISIGMEADACQCGSIWVVFGLDW